MVCFSRTLPIALLIASMGLLGACGTELDAPDGKKQDGNGSLVNPLPVDGVGGGDGDDGGDGDTASGDGDGDGDGDTTGDGDGDGDGDIPTDPPPVDIPPSPYPPPPNEGDACYQWSDCGPYGADQNSGYECINNACTCDPGGHWSDTCTAAGGFWVYTDCLCTFAETPPPTEYAGDGCYWHWEEGVCDPDRWVDTSHYEDDCYYDSNNDLRCDSVWVTSGYYEDGACPSPYWDKRC